jgi:hypothetical protein
MAFTPDGASTAGAARARYLAGLYLRASMIWLKYLTRTIH